MSIWVERSLAALSLLRSALPLFHSQAAPPSSPLPPDDLASHVISSTPILRMPTPPPLPTHVRERTPSPLDPTPPRAPTPGVPREEREREREREREGGRRGVIPPVGLIDYPSRSSRSSRPRDERPPRRSASTGPSRPPRPPRDYYGGGGSAPMDLRSERRAGGQRPGERGKVGIVQGVKNLLGAGSGGGGRIREEDDREWGGRGDRRGRRYEGGYSEDEDRRRRTGGGVRPPGGALPSAMRRPDHGGGYYSDEDPRYADRRPRDRRRPRFEDDLPRGAGRAGGPDSSEEDERYQRKEARSRRDRRGYEDDGLDYASRGGGGRRDRGPHPLDRPHDPFSTSALYDALPHASSSRHPADEPYRPGHMTHSARPLHDRRTRGEGGAIDSSEDELDDRYGRRVGGGGGGRSHFDRYNDEPYFDPRMGGGRGGGYPDDYSRGMMGMGRERDMMPGFVPHGGLPPRDPYSRGGGYDELGYDSYPGGGGGVGRRGMLGMGMPGGYPDEGLYGGGGGGGMGMGMGMRGGGGRYGGGW